MYVQRLRYLLGATARVLLLRIVQPVLSLWPRCGQNRKILFVAYTGMEVVYLTDLWEILRRDERLRSYALGPFELDYRQRTPPGRGISALRAYVGRWDLVVAADHPFGPKLCGIVDRDRWPTLRIPHGIPGKRFEGEIYAFGRLNYKENGRIRYTCMFVGSESERETAIAVNPAFQEVVAVVGSLQNDKLLALAEHREDIRRKLGFKAEDKVVFVLSTWGPHGLFNSMGDVLLSNARKLHGEFRFVLSVHPLDYRPTPSGQRVWGDYIRSQKQYGFIIREPDEDWMPYMVACDVILTDHTALALQGTLIRRPTVFVPVPNGVIEKKSPCWHLKNISPVIKDDASDLKDRLLDALRSYPFETLAQIADIINSYPGQSANRVRKEVYEFLKLTPPPNYLDGAREWRRAPSVVPEIWDAPRFLQKGRRTR